MPAERAPMRKVREVLRLRHALGVSERQIAITIGVSRSTVGEYLRRAAVIGITWPVPEGLDDGDPAQKWVDLGKIKITGCRRRSREQIPVEHPWDLHRPAPNCIGCLLRTMPVSARAVRSSSSMQSFTRLL